MNILGISASPRKKGNTQALLDEFLRGSTEQGAAVSLLNIAEKSIAACTHCDYCLRHGRCVQDDDMVDIYNQLEQTDALVLASPIYFMAHCAQAKLLIDRCQPFWARRYALKQPPPDTPRYGCFISTAATHGPKVFAGARTTNRWFFDTLSMIYWGNVCFEGVDESGAIHQHPTALKDAYEAGQRFATIRI